MSKASYTSEEISMTMRKHIYTYILDIANQNMRSFTINFDQICTVPFRVFSHLSFINHFIDYSRNFSWTLLRGKIAISFA